MRSGLLLALVTMLCVMAGTTEVAAQPAVEACVASFSDGQVQQKRGRLADAIRIYAECAGPTCPAQVREDCARKRTEVERALPTIVVVVRDGNGKDVPSKVTIDGVIFDTSAGNARPIDPGPHVISYGPVGATPREEKVTIVEGEKSRSIILAWTGPIPPPPPAAAEKKAEETAPAPADRVPPPQHSRSIGPYILGGFGVVAAFVSIGLFVLARNEGSKGTDLRQQANAAKLRGDTTEERNANAAADSHFQSADNTQLLSIFVGIPSLLAIGGAVVWFVVDTPPSPKAAKLTPLVGRGFVGLGATF